MAKRSPNRRPLPAAEAPSTANQRGGADRAPGSATDASPWTPPPALVSLLLSAATCLVFAPTLWCGFLNFDDDLYLVDNRPMHEGVSLASLRWAATAVVGANWHPFTLLSHLLDCQLYGLNPWGHHLTNVLWHATTVGLVYLLLGRLTGRWQASLFVAAIWGWHPLRVESVAWVAERKDVLSGCLALATLLAYTGWARHPSPLRYLATFLLLLLGLLAKPMLVTLPAVMVLLDYWPLGRLAPTPEEQGGRGPGNAFARRLMEKAPLLALAAAMALVTYWVQSRHGSVRGFDLLPLELRLSNAVWATATYARQLVWPGPLAVYYPHPQLGWSAPQVWLSATGLLGISAAVVVARRRGYPVVSWLWFLGMLVPVIGLIQVGGAGRSDRYTYLPHLGLAWGLVWAWADLGRSGWVARRAAFWLKLAPVLAGLFVAGLVIETQLELRHWRSSETLFRRALAVTGDNDLAWNNLGWALIEEGRPAEALAPLREAQRLRPEQVEPVAGEAMALQVLERWDEAEAAYARALPLARGSQAELLNNYAWLLATHADPARRRPAEARRHVERAIALEPEPRSDFLDTLAATYAAEGRWAEAVEAQAQALAAASAEQPDRNELARRLAEYRRHLEPSPPGDGS